MDTIFGDNCNLSNGVTIGEKFGGQNAGIPRIGNRVYLGPHAILIGNISIGDDAAIGAGAVVTTSVPERGVAAGNPARILSQKGSFDYITYQNMQNDPPRQASQALVEK